MRYLLDTNTWIHYLKRVGSPVEARLQQTPAAEVAVCSVVWAELLHEAQKYEKREERVARIERTFASFRGQGLAAGRSPHRIRHGCQPSF